jgi:hypothetical protein
LPPPDIEAELLDAVQRIALALECINRQLFLIREMMEGGKEC